MKSIKNLVFVAFALMGLIFFSCKKEKPFENTRPVIEDQVFSVDENSDAGTVIDTVLASDIDHDQTLSFTILSGNTDDVFSIEASTGKLSVNITDALNYEEKQSFLLSVKVSDNYPESLSDSANITVMINDIDEVPKNGLIAYYPFNGNANDESGNAHHGTVFGATLSNDRHNKANSAYEFDGTNDYINTFSTFDYDYRTVSLWVKAYEIHNVYPDNSNVISQNSSSLTYGAVVVQFDGGILYNNAGGSNNSNVLSFNNIVENSWYHMVLIRNGSQTKYYINTVKVYTAISGTDAATFNPNPLFIIGSGRSTTSQFFYGKVDDIAIYNRVLSEGEIKLLNGAK
jgi:hypothetical protein